MRCINAYNVGGVRNLDEQTTGSGKSPVIYFIIVLQQHHKSALY